METEISNFQEYVKAWRGRIARNEKKSRHWNEEGWEIANHLAEILSKRKEVVAVYLFGSIARKDYHTQKPDLDVAVRLTSDSLIRSDVLRDLEAESPFDIDLVDLAECNQRLKNAIQRDGVILYERSQD